jgi:MscS family membrane protein
MKQFEMMITQYLEHHPLVDKNNITVRFNLMGDFNLQILVNCFIFAATGPIELQFQEDLLFTIKDMAAQIAVEFAYPTQTVLVKPTPLTYTNSNN